MGRSHGGVSEKTGEALVEKGPGHGSMEAVSYVGGVGAQMGSTPLWTGSWL